MLSLVFAVGMGLSLSTTAMVARRIGEKDPEGAAVAAVQAIALGLMVSVAIGVPCSSAGASPTAVDGRIPRDRRRRAADTRRICLGGSCAVLLLFLNNAIFRGAGDAAIAMRLLWVSNIINLVLDPCLIFGWGPFPKMGVTGAALGDAHGRSIGVIYQFYRLLQGTERIRILRASFACNFDVLWRLVRVSLTGILQFAIAHTSWIGLVRIVSIFGAAALAGYTIAIRIVIFVILPSWGLSNAAATLVGQNLGAGKPERAEAVSLAHRPLQHAVPRHAWAFSSFCSRSPWSGYLQTMPRVVPLAASCLRIVSCGNIGYAYGMVMLQAFNGAGDTITPTIVNFFGFWALEIPLAYWLAIPTPDAVERRVLGDCDCGMFHRGSQRNLVQAGKMEEAENLRMKCLSRARQNQGDIIGLFVVADPVSTARVTIWLIWGRGRSRFSRTRSIRRCSPNSPKSFSGSVTPSL